MHGEFHMDVFMEVGEQKTGNMCHKIDYVCKII